MVADTVCPCGSNSITRMTHSNATSVAGTEINELCAQNNIQTSNPHLYPHVRPATSVQQFASQHTACSCALRRLVDWFTLGSMKQADRNSRSFNMMSSPNHMIRGLMLTVLLGIFGLAAYVAFPASTPKDPQQRSTQAGSRTSSSYSRNYVYDVPPVAPSSNPASDSIQVSSYSNTKMSQLKNLLPLMNFSSLTSARILDAAAAVAKNSSHQEMWGMMQTHQELFCAAEMHLRPAAGIRQVPIGNVTLHVYNGKDIVSDQLAGDQHTWEASEIQQMLWALRQFTTQQQQQVTQNQQQRRRQQTAADNKMPLFVDVGANVGWFALKAAVAGARVAAFEAMPSNIELIRRSLCYNPWLADRFALYGTGLGSSPSSCAIISGSTNRGDGHTICGQDVQEYLNKQNQGANDRYEVRGEMSIRRIDTIIAEDVQVMKIDVEGFELQVLEGAEELLANHNVWYILAECNGGITSAEGQKKYLRFMDKMGYSVSSYSFTGPFLTPERIAAGTADIPEFANLYCVKKELLPVPE